jgi:hypothetical protein
MSNETGPKVYSPSKRIIFVTLNVAGSRLHSGAIRNLKSEVCVTKKGTFAVIVTGFPSGSSNLGAYKKNGPLLTFTFYKDGMSLHLGGRFTIVTTKLSEVTVFMPSDI